MNSVIYTPDRLALTEESTYECPHCYAKEEEIIKTGKDIWICRCCWYKNHRDFFITKTINHEPY